MNNFNLINSDFHNFGKKVRFLNDNTLVKPRSVFWERLFLGESAFRVFLEELINQKKVPYKIKFALPFLKVKEISMFEGSVERLSLNAIDYLDIDHALSIGGTIALFAWFGITDLHSGNMVLGQEVKTGNFIFSTIDIETVMDDIQLLSHAAITSDQWISKEDSGVAEILKLMNDKRVSESFIAAVLDSYINTLKFLEQNRSLIESQFLLELRDRKRIPLRVFLRKTKVYGEAIYQQKNTSLDSFLLEEKVQLSRKEIPFFFRFNNAPDTIYFFRNEHEYTEIAEYEIFKHLKLIKRRNFDQTRAEPATGFEKIIKFGTLQLARTLLTSSTGELVQLYGNTLMRKYNNEFFIEHENSFRFACKL